MKTDIITLEKHIQVISSDLMEALKESAADRGISLDMEIALRLMAYMAEPALTKDNSLFSQIMRKEFTEDEAVAECKRNREATLRLFEIEKLRILLKLENKLPRKFKENFTLIDVKAISEIIKTQNNGNTED